MIERVPGAKAAFVLAGGAVLLALLVVGLALTVGPDSAATLGSVGCVVVGILGGLVAVSSARQPGGQFRFYAGLAWLGCTLGWSLDLLVGHLPRWVHSVGYATVSVTIVTLFYLCLRRLPVTRLPGQVTRIVPEALMIGAAGGAALYRLFFRSTGREDTWVELMVALFVSVIALSFAAATVEPYRGMWPCSVGAMMLTAAELVAIHSWLLGSPLWTARVTSLLGWALVLVGFFQMPTRAAHLGDRAIAALEERHLLLVGSAIVVAAGAFVASLAITPGVGNATWALTGLFVCALWLREWVRARQSGRMFLRLHDQAELDPLTGLGNRWRLRTRAMELAAAPPDQVSVMTIDLDAFQDVNDLSGHTVGDRVLTDVGTGLAELGGAYKATAYRVGGDEFAMVAVTGPAMAEQLAADVIAEITRRTAVVRGVGATALGASVGVRHIDGRDLLHRDGVDRVLKSVMESGHAMRVAKRTARGTTVVYDDELRAAYRRAKQIEARLRSGDGDGPDVHFQPVMSLGTGRIIGVEALARWTDAELGFVPPAEFVEVAEGCGLIVELGDHILRRALAGAVEAGLISRGLSVAVNVSTIQLRAPGFVTTVAEALAAAGVSSSQLVIEVTESVFVRQEDPAVRALNQLSAMGVRVALDDFGSGYSSFSYLPRLPIHVLKLDRSLTADFDDPRSLAISRTVLDLALALGFSVVVEGIETPAQRDTAAALGAQHAQGWFYAKAMPMAELAAYLRSQDADFLLSTIPAARSATESKKA